MTRTIFKINFCVPLGSYAILGVCKDVWQSPLYNFEER